MNRNYAQSRAMLETVAAALGDVAADVVFVGGAVLGLLLDDPAAAQVRQTVDVDLVAEVVSLVAFHDLNERLRARGFREDASSGAPICRWKVHGVTVDVMPSDPKVLGFSNPWYPRALATATWHQLTPQRIRVIAAPCFMATKLEAFANRGAGDALASHDIEDVVTLIDGRAGLLEELAHADPELRRFVEAHVARLFLEGAGLDVLQAHLGPDNASQRRAVPLLQRLRSGIGKA